MTSTCFLVPITLLTIVCSSSGATTSAPGVPISVIVTVEAKGEARTLSKQSVVVQEDRESRSITEVSSLEGAPTQMLLLIDDSAGGSFDTQIPELKKFVESLAANVEVGVGYMHNGMSQMVGEFSLDHGKVANSIRLPEGAGGADVSPYDSLTDAIKKWPVKPEIQRREVVMISSGIEGLGGGLPPENPYVNAGIASAQRAGVIVYAIYNPAFGHFGHSLWQSSFGQNLLSQLTDETGGEMYWIGNGSAVTFEPYFADILKRQSEQYVLQFEARAEKKSALYDVKIRSSVKGVSLTAPDKVFVKASL